MRRTSPASLEKLFAVLVTVGIPVGAMVACGGAIRGEPGSGEDAGGASSGAGSSGGSSSGAIGTSSGVVVFNSSGSSSSGSSSGTVGSTSASSGAIPPGLCTPYPVTLDGGLPDAAGYSGTVPPFIDGGLPLSECEQYCPGSAPLTFCQVESVGPPAVIGCSYECLGGRRPAELRCERAHGTRAGAYFASLAQLEGASVPAFRRMARELSRFGAPRRLVKAAERAAREEVRHARGAASLAKRFGATPASFTADVRGERSLEAFAIENAVEGCVRETYGALLATWQAREAGDPLVRAHMARIAKEETTHAALAWRADAWARAKLTKEARARVEAARRNAVRTLMDDVATAPDDEVTAIAGVPTAIVAQRLASELVASLG